MDRAVIISTWKFGIEANEAAWDELARGGDSLDAAERGVRVIEDDPNVSSVGYGGLPDEQMVVTLDASIMDWRGNCGAVAALPKIKNAVSVARAVMERSPHVMLVGEGAYEFAVANGFSPEEILLAKSREEWLKWKEGRGSGQARLGADEMDESHGSHDTVGLLVLDAQAHLSGAMSTSGTAWKLHGRVGDSPIIGAGLYVDGQVGAAAGTGVGEANMRVVGAHLIVEQMRAGASPQDACEIAVHRVAELLPQALDDEGFQLAYIALSAAGETGSASVRRGFQVALHEGGVNRLLGPGFTYLP